MVKWEEIRHQVAISGRVTDAQTSKAISGAHVKITDAPPEFTKWLALRAQPYGARWLTMTERPDQTRTAADGSFRFIDLPQGQYTLTATLPGSGSRYGTTEVQVQVSENAMATANMALPATTLKGQITKQDSTPIVMAEVRVKGSGERTFSDKQGQYRLTGLETGQRIVLVSAQGFQLASQSVDLSQPGIERTLNFVLVPLT